MCGRFTLTASPETLKQEFNLASVPQDLSPRYNIAPTQPAAVVVNSDEGRLLDAFQWGLIPFWAKDRQIGNRMINARAETLAAKASFKGPLKERRCLVLADGFFEWRKTPQGKIPTYIYLEDHKPFAFAGLWERWEAPEGAVIHSCTIITTPPNSLVEPIHNRMPAILTPAAIETWLNPEEHNPDHLLPLLGPYPAAAMAAHAVSRMVNSPGNDRPEIIAPV